MLVSLSRHPRLLKSDQADLGFGSLETCLFIVSQSVVESDLMLTKYDKVFRMIKYNCCLDGCRIILYSFGGLQCF